MLTEKALYRLTYMARDRSALFGDLLFKGDKYPTRVRLQGEMFGAAAMGLGVPREAIVRAVGVSSSGEGTLVCPDLDDAWAERGAPADDVPEPLALYTFGEWKSVQGSGVREVISVDPVQAIWP